MTTPSQNYFNLGKTKTMTEMLSALLERTMLIFSFLSTNLNSEIALKTLQIENIKKKKKKKKLMTKNTPYYTKTKEDKKYASISKI